MIQISMDEIREDPPAFLQRIEAGEKLIIIIGGKPVAEVNPIPITKHGLRPFGLCAGEFRVPDDFDDPLPEDILKAFEGESPIRVEARQIPFTE